ncbi:hypothetical protein V6N13_108384 [Hibiscus sabdariffa]
MSGYNQNGHTSLLAFVFPRNFDAKKQAHGEHNADRSCNFNHGWRSKQKPAATLFGCLVRYLGTYLHREPLCWCYLDHSEAEGNAI